MFFLNRSAFSIKVVNTVKQSPSREADSRSAGKKIPCLYETRRFIIVFTRARHWSLCWVKWIQSTPSRLISL